MNLSLLLGAEALNWLAQPSNRAAWEELHRSWGGDNPYTSPDFAGIRYTHYAETHVPILILGHDDSAELIALAPLASAGHNFSGAGAQQAEYPGWLCPAARHREFVSALVTLIAGHDPQGVLKLRYVTQAEAITAWQSLAGQDPRARVEIHQCPMLEVGNDAVRAALKKKGNRSKLNRLRRLGTLELKRARTLAEFDEYLDQAFVIYDLRQGAKNNDTPFCDDGAKRDFLRNWYEQCPDDIYASILLLDGKVVAALFGVVRGRSILNAIIAHDPALAAHSVSKFHLYLLAQELDEQALETLDLTPGGDPWKERFATMHSDVATLEFHADVSERRRLDRDAERLKWLKQVLGRVGISPDDARAMAATAKRVTPAKLVARARNKIHEHVEYRVYRMAGSAIPETTDAGRALRNQFADLLAFDETQASASRQMFLASACERLASGERVYTVGEQDTLAHYGWLIERQEKTVFSEIDYAYEFPEPGAVLYDFYTHPDSRGQKLYQSTIQQMLGDIRRFDEPPAWVYITVLADNLPSRHVIEKLGFDYLESVVRTTRFGKPTWRVTQIP